MSILTDSQKLTVLEKTREMLSWAYIPWKKWDSLGGYCQLGCYEKTCKDLAAEKVVIRYVPYVPTWAEGSAMKEIEQAAICLHPQLVGAFAVRLDGAGQDDFNDAPAVYVNNHLGKEAILRVYDEAIRVVRERIEDSQSAAAVTELCTEFEGQEHSEPPQEMTQPVIKRGRLMSLLVGLLP